MKDLPFGEYVTHLEYHNSQTLQKIISLIIKDDNRYLLLTDSLDKFNDIEKMPDYIQKDWLKYNSNEITEIELDKLKEKLKRWTSVRVSDQIYEEHMEQLNILKSIQRDIRIKNLLS